MLRKTQQATNHRSHKGSFLTWALLGGAAFLAGLILSFLTQPSLSNLGPTAKQADPSVVGEELESGQMSPDRGAPSARPAPRFTAPGFGPVQNDPNAADYNPLELLKLSGPDAASAIFRSEPRNSAWATEMEREMVAAVKAELSSRLPGAELSLDCHTLSCKVVIGLPPASNGPASRDAAMIVMQSPPLADRVAFTADNSDGPNDISGLLFFGPKARDATTWPTWYAKKRAMTTARLRRTRAGREYYPAGTFEQTPSP